MKKLAGLLVLAASIGGSGASVAQEIEAVSLYDSFGSEEKGAVLDWGFSMLIRYRGKTILFDGGASARLLKHNTASLGVDLREVDIAVLSHSHYDHISGFDYLLEVNPNVEIFLPKDRTIGGRPARSEEQAKWNTKNELGYRFPGANVRYVDSQREIAPGVWLFPTTSELMGLFSKYPPHEKEPLFVGLPELSLALETAEGGWVIVAGCSHSGVLEIVREAKDHLKGRIDGLVGGFHLFPYSSEEVSSVVKSLQDLSIGSVAAAHCTGEEGHSILKEAFGENYTAFGLGAAIKF